MVFKFAWLQAVAVWGEGGGGGGGWTSYLRNSTTCPGSKTARVSLISVTMVGYRAFLGFWALRFDLASKSSVVIEKTGLSLICLVSSEP